MNYYDYCKSMADPSIRYDEILILATADYLERNITVLTKKYQWDYEDQLEPDIVVFLAGANHVVSSREGNFYLYF